MGDGINALGSAAASIAVLEISTSGSLTQTIVFPSSGSDPQTDSGSASSDGYLNVNAGYVSVSGYNAAAATAGVASQNSKVNSFIDLATGSITSRTLFPTGGASGTPPSPFSGNNFRSSIATSGSTFYAVGTASGSPNTGGAWYYNGASFVQVSSTTTGQPTNVRGGRIFNNQFYASSATSSGTGVFTIGTGLPTSAGQTATLAIPTGSLGTAASPYAFVLFDTNNDSTLDLAYIADDRTTTGGGLQKWTFNGSTWSNSWALLVNGTSSVSATAATGFAGIRGLGGSYDLATSTASLFATTTETSNNRLIAFADSGITPTTFSTLQSAGTNYVFRGVDVVPVPEPSTVALTACGLGVVMAAGFRRFVQRGCAERKRLRRQHLDPPERVAC